MNDLSFGFRILLTKTDIVEDGSRLRLFDDVVAAPEGYPLRWKSIVLADLWWTHCGFLAFVMFVGNIADGMGMENQLRINACMLATAPPFTSLLNRDRDKSWMGTPVYTLDCTHDLDHK